MHQRQRLYISYTQAHARERKTEAYSTCIARKMNQSCGCMIHDDRAMVARQGWTNHYSYRSEREEKRAKNSATTQSQALNNN